MSQPQVNTESSATSDKPSFLMTDILIQSKLKKAGIVLVDADNENKEKLTVENGVDSFKKDLLRHNQLTIIVFTHYCLIPMQRVLRELDPQLLMKSSDIATISVMFAGYIRAGVNFGNCIPNNNTFTFATVLPKLFEKKEFEDIISCLKFLLSAFPDQIQKTMQWLKEDIKPRKQQMDAMMDLMKLLRKTPIDEIPEKHLKKTAKKVLDVCMPGGADNDHNLSTLQAREQLLWFSPEKELLINIERILTYLDILSYAGFFPETAHLPEKADELNFKSFLLL